MRSVMLAVVVVVAAACSSPAVERAEERQAADPVAVADPPAAPEVVSAAAPVAPVQPEAAAQKDEDEAAQSFVPVRALLGRSRKEVAALLGEPIDDCEKTKHGPKCTYRDGAVEIVFIRKKADWFTIKLPGQPYRLESLRALGLESRAPSFANEYSMRWNGIPGILELSMNPGETLPDGQRGIFFVYLKARTK